MSQQIIYDYAVSYLGTPYRWGGDDPINGIDCSGLVIEILQAAGIFPRGYDSPAKAIFKDLQRQGAVFASKAQFGTILFFGKTPDTISHTGFALSEKLFIEAGGGDSSVINNQVAAVKNAFVRIRPITWRSDLSAMVDPKYFWR